MQAFLTETMETGDRNRDDFHCMQMSRDEHAVYFFGYDWSDACKLITFLLFGNESLNWGPLSRVIMHDMHAY